MGETDEMNAYLRPMLWFCTLIVAFAITLPAPARAEHISMIFDSSGIGSGQNFQQPWGIAVGSNGDLLLTGSLTDNVFRITPEAVETEIIDATGDGTNPLEYPTDVTVDSEGNVYVTAQFSNNAFKITPEGTITQIIDVTGDGTGDPEGALLEPWSVAVDSSGNVFVAGFASNNVFKIATPGSCSTSGTPCTITEIINATGDGVDAMTGPFAVATDSSGNVFVAAWVDDINDPPPPPEEEGLDHRDKVLKITPGGAITEIIDEDGSDGP